ncbi:MAG: NADH-quinone oxidoreductase subunit NuoG [Fimbriimonadaceae bacterium]|nr:NADH-quinone oxidoreductase subunit NuoG [Fimbriimonadaceae bacterium]
MAAATTTDTVTITVNDIELQVPKGELIVESVKRLGLEIPIFCYHPRMKPVGMCRMCLVEVGFKQPDGSIRKMPKPQAGCTLGASDGMVIYTDTAEIHEDRKGVLEFLLINHPLDCPICDRGGECPLQNNTLAYGPSTSRFLEVKRHLPKAFPLSQYVTLDLERCIQCGRCVRFTEEISGDHQLAFRFRGAMMQPSTYQLTDFESKFSGNVIEICPVGALTSAKYRFRARPWDLETMPGICTLTPDGTNIYYDRRAGKLVRINGRTNESVNEEWTCDKTKFGAVPLYNSSDRLTTPHLRNGEGFEPASWSAAYHRIIESLGEGSSAMLLSPTLSNEAIFVAKELANQAFEGMKMDARGGYPSLEASDAPESALGIPGVGLSTAEIEDQSTLFVFSAHLADEQPMTYLRVRKAWLSKGAKVVVATSEPTEVEQFASVILRYQPGTAGALIAGLASIAKGGSASEVAQTTGVSEENLRAAVELLESGPWAGITTHRLLNESDGVKALHEFFRAASAGGGKASLLAPAANSQGAAILGVNSARTTEVLEQAANGQLKSLWLVGFDPLSETSDRSLAERALEAVDFLVVQHTHQCEAAAFASVILPMAMPAEAEGTYVSSERRLQYMGQCLTPPGDAKPAWRIFSELKLQAAGGTPLFNPKEIFQAIVRSTPEFDGLNYARLSGEGVRLGYPSLDTSGSEPTAQSEESNA